MKIDTGVVASIEELVAGQSEWDAFVLRSPGSSHAHQWAWGDVIAASFGHVTRRWVARDSSGAICGVLPVTFVKSIIFGRHAVSVPFLNYGGPIGSSEVIQPLVDVALRESAAAAFRGIELRSHAPLPITATPSVRKVTVVLALPASADELLKRFDAKLRSQVRRAVKDGASVTHGPQDFDGFYRVFQHHMRDLGTPVMPRRFFEAALAAFPESTWISCVRHEGQPIAAAMGFRWGDEFEITWASSLVAYKKMSPNMLLYWGLLSRCIDEGVRTFNFGRTTPGSGPHRFKLQWGGQEEPLHWYSLGITKAPQKEQRIFSLATRVWQRLPLRVANALGPAIVRGIP